MTASSNKKSVICIKFVITNLAVGGAEMMLFKLLRFIDRSKFHPEVISLVGIGAIGEKIKALGIPVTALGMRSKAPSPRSLWRLRKMITSANTDLIQTWMYHADLLGTIAALGSRKKVIWNIRHSNLDRKADKASTILIAKMCAKLSNFAPAKIISCSKRATEIHNKLGYNLNKMVVIPNGFDLDRFKPSLEARTSLRSSLNLPKDALIVGMVGRYHPQKDHNNFFKAANLLKQELPDCHFVLCGRGLTHDNLAIVDTIKSLGLEGCVHLLGERSDIEEVIAGFDITTLTSYAGEGFPNVVGEAMACEVPCVVTDVGDSSYVIGNTGITVPPKHSDWLAQAWAQILNQPVEQREALGKQARQRIIDNFEIKNIAKRYEDLYESLVAGVAFPPRAQ